MSDSHCQKWRKVKQCNKSKYCWLYVNSNSMSIFGSNFSKWEAHITKVCPLTFNFLWHITGKEKRREWLIAWRWPHCYVMSCDADLTCHHASTNNNHHHSIHMGRPLVINLTAASLRLPKISFSWHGMQIKHACTTVTPDIYIIKMH